MRIFPVSWKIIFPVFFLYLLIPSTLQANADETLPHLDLNQRQRLERGEVIVVTSKIPDQPAGTMQAAVLIETKAELIWKTLINCDRAPKFFPGLEACRILETNADTKIMEHQVKLSWYLPRMTYVFKARYEPFRRIEFKRIGGDLDAMEGHWVMNEIHGGRKTIVAYSVFMDPGIFVPQWLVHWVLRDYVPEFLLALRRSSLQPTP
jgi:ribosome-associated toxin RatA of RatAB toxin-antitoxin module